MQDEFITEEALARRENWERCAANAYQQPDEQVLAMIAEIRRLRDELLDRNNELDEIAEQLQND